MATPDPASVKEHTSNSFDWTLGAKVRDGRYGPVFLGLRSDTGELISAEEFTPGGEPGAASSALESVVATLESRLMASPALPRPNVIPLLGYEVRGGSILVLTEYVPGGTLRDLIRSYGAVPRALARSILRQVVLGLEQLRGQGVAPVLLGLDAVMLDNRGTAKIEAPLLDAAVATPAVDGRPPDAALLLAPPPELLLLGRQEDLGGKADAWLFGVMAAQLLTGDGALGQGASAGSVVARIKEFRGASAVELLVPGDAGGKVDGDALSLIRGCLTMDVDLRPSISDLLGHPFFRGSD